MRRSAGYAARRRAGPDRAAHRRSSRSRRSKGRARGNLKHGLPSVKQCSTAREAARGCARSISRKSASASRWCRKRLLLPFRQGELQLESPPLLGRRREIPEVVETAFTGCDDHRIGSCAPSRSASSLQARRVVRVDTGGRAKALRMLPAERNGPVSVVQGTAGHDHRDDARGAGALTDGIAIHIEAVVREIGADIDEGRHRAPPPVKRRGAPSSRAGARPAAPVGTRRPCRSRRR